ncbi:MAG: ABC transporter permease, partial [Streptococcaceae bacterium]|nr:ABC transporter permease [Streptococcaceae bacterium]
MRQLNHNILMEFKKTKSRFLSLVILLSLAIFVFIGLSIVGSDMRSIARREFAKTHMADVEVTSTIGLTDSVKNELKKLKGVSAYEFGSQTQVLIQQTNKVLTIASMPKKLNTVTLTSGKLPQNNQEIVLSSTAKNKYKIGDTITVSSPKTETILAESRFKITGFVKSMNYFKASDLGNSNLGNGEVYAYAFVNLSAFTSDSNNLVNLKLSKIQGQPFETAYEKAIAKKVKQLQVTLNQLNTTRINDLNTQVNEQLADAKNQLDTGENELARGRSQLNTLIATFGEKPEFALQQENLKQQEEALEVAKTEINTAKEKQKDLENVSLIAQSRQSFIEGYADYGESTLHLDDLAKTFPIIFFLIAILVTLTTMNRMVDENRIEIGTLRALGFTKREVIRKFTLYSLAIALISSVVGSAFGFLLLPKLVIQPYATMYNLGNFHYLFSLPLVIIALILAILSTVLVTYLSARVLLHQTPKALMTPEKPKGGTR